MQFRIGPVHRGRIFLSLIDFSSTFALKNFKFSDRLSVVLEGRRIAQPFLKLLRSAGFIGFRKGWEESPNTTGRDAA